MEVKPGHYIVLSLAVLLFNTSAIAAPSLDSLGRLFFTPDERFELEQLRREAKRPQFKPQIPRKPPPVPNLIVFNGMVLRSNGESTVWVNGSTKPQNNGLIVETGKREGLNVPIFIVNGERRIELKPGQSHNTRNQANLEGYQTHKMLEAGTAVIAK